jgi:hypothetical protein
LPGTGGRKWRTIRTPTLLRESYSAGYTLAWQRLDAARNVEASAAIMRGDAEPMRKMLDTLVSDGSSQHYGAARLIVA